MSVLESVSVVRRRLELEGVVQGVGFRPFVVRLARAMNVSGWVANRSGGVVIEAEATASVLVAFERCLRTDKPGPARIDRLLGAEVPPQGASGFHVAPTLADAANVPALQPDAVTCPACLDEMRDPANRRFRYPFISCAECGPRFSITEALPFDRARTTLIDFPLCPACEAEYADPADRRFHAQTMGCPQCGPQLWLRDFQGERLHGAEAALAEAVAVLREGGIVGLKGLGGYQLVVDACNEAAVVRLRQRKARPAKPLALMLGDLAAVHARCAVSAEEAALLASSAGPIVLLNRRQDDLAPSVAFDSPCLGVMLPSSGLHALLLAQFGGPLVVTSGNRAELPIAISDEAAETTLTDIADVLLGHTRRVAARLDDSVAQIVLGAPQVLRRARGFVPLSLPLDTGRCMLALGAQQKNTIALGLGGVAVLSQHNGDLDSEPACTAFTETVAAQLALYGMTPEQVLIDAHPDYIASRRGRELAARHPVSVARVWHHPAHIHAVVAERGVSLPVTGVAWDGLGLGPDNALWGGECFAVTLDASRHVASFLPFPLPGGEVAAREPRRVALGVLHALEGEHALAREVVVGAFSPAELRILGQMLAKGVNCPPTSSVGRLFDAMASLLGLRQRSAFEGDAAMQVQFAAERATEPAIPYAFVLDGAVVDWRPLLGEVLSGLVQGVSVPQIARCFHVTLAAIIVALAQREGCPQVVLSGGCFQNRLLLSLAVAALTEAGFIPLWSQQVPTNDGGLALGQLGAARFGHFAAGRALPQECV